MRWSDIKKKGNEAYKSGKIEPIDLFKEGSILWDWCIGEIIAKAYRNREDTTWNWKDVGLYTITNVEKVKEDIDEIIHYAEMLKVIIDEAKGKESINEV